MMVKKFVFLLLVMLCSVPSIMGMKPFVRDSRGIVSRKLVSSRVFRAWSLSYSDARVQDAVYELVTIINYMALGATGSSTVAGGGTSSGTTSCARRVDQTIAIPPVLGEVSEAQRAPDVRDVVPNSAFVKYAYVGDTCSIIDSLKRGQGPNEVDQNGRTALIWAAISGNKGMVQELLNVCAKVDIQDVQGFTALMMAVYRGDTEIISLLLGVSLRLGARAQLNLKSDAYGGETALMFAVDRGKGEAVRLLIAAGAKINSKRRRDRATALMLAADHGDVGIVKQLLKAGAKPNIQQKTGWTALMYAARGGYIDVVRELIAAGAQSNLQILELNMQTYEESFTALMIAAAHGRANIAELLLEAGANPWICDSHGRNSFSFAEQNKHNGVLCALRNYVNRPVREQAACAPRDGVGLGSTGGGMVLSPNASPDPVWSVEPAAGTAAV